MGIPTTDEEKKKEWIVGQKETRNRIGGNIMLQGYMKVLMGGQNQGKLANNQVFHSLEFQ
ncbi:hypothetical protein N7536_010153 [Penicillium majusculum]|nr:hypothetical protein N7536_010153 [Penicillium majusculum]